MALSIKTEEADRLARELSRLTGESMTQAVTVSLRERLERAKQRRKKRTKLEVQDDLRRMNIFLEEERKNFDFRKPITKADFDRISGDNDILAAMKVRNAK